MKIFILKIAHKIDKDFLLMNFWNDYNNNFSLILNVPKLIKLLLLSKFILWLYEYSSHFLKIFVYNITELVWLLYI